MANRCPEPVTGGTLKDLSCAKSLFPGLETVISNAGNSVSTPSVHFTQMTKVHQLLHLPAPFSLEACAKTHSCGNQPIAMSQRTLHASPRLTATFLVRH